MTPVHQSKRHLLLLVVFICGCNRSGVDLPTRPPRPVTTALLSKGVTDSSNVVSGSVKAWKTEDIGFEVGGRLLSVMEPGETVDARIVTSDGNVIQQGTPLARIDPVRFEIAVQSAQANLEITQLSKESIEIQLGDSLPAELEAARADLRLAEIEFGRMEKLNRQNAASRSEYDQAKNAVQNREATIKSLLARQKQSQAELRSSEAEIKRAEQALRDAQRDLDNTVLYGSYQGQISQVMVVPGSVVTAGSPVLTLQMTTPIKAEIELSDKQSRRLRRRRNLPATVTLPDGSIREQFAFVYSIDPSADPSTRTFTMTLLFLNEQFREDTPQAPGDSAIARTKDVWPVKLNRLMGAGDELTLVEKESILRDADGPYIYMVENAGLRETLPPVMKVRKQRLTENELQFPFLGIWSFQSVRFEDPTNIDENSIYAGELETGDIKPSEWTGDSVALDSGAQWLLRPGDLVSIDISDESVDDGFYVPMKAIYENNGETSIFVSENDRCRQLSVSLKPSSNLDAGSMVGIESPELIDGMQVIVGGVHYLTDGEPITNVGAQTMSPLVGQEGV